MPREPRPITVGRFLRGPLQDKAPRVVGDQVEWSACMFCGVSDHFQWLLDHISDDIERDIPRGRIQCLTCRCLLVAEYRETMGSRMQDRRGNPWDPPHQYQWYWEIGAMPTEVPVQGGRLGLLMTEDTSWHP